MANIRVYAPNGAGAGEEYRDALLAAGHTVDFDTAGGIGSPTGFDALVVQTGPQTQSHIQAFIGAGLGVVVVDSGNGTTRGANLTDNTRNAFAAWGLAASYSRERPSFTIADLAPNHFITDGLSDPQGYLNSGTTTAGVLDLPLLNGGAHVPILALGDQLNTTLDEGAAVVAFERGLVYYNNGTPEALPVRVAWLGAAGVKTGANGDPTGYNAAGEALAVNAVEWVLGLSSAVDPVAAFTGYPTGLLLNLTDHSLAIAVGAEIVKRYWTFNDGDQVSLAVEPTFVAPSAGTYEVGLTVWDSNGNSHHYAQSFTFGAGSSEPPYDLPTTKAAGRFLIKLDSTVDWTGVTGVVTDSDGGKWLNHFKFPKPGGGTECRVKNREIANGPDQPVRTLRANLILGGAAGSLSSGAIDSFANLLSGSFSPVVFGAREVLVQTPLGDPDSTDPDDWRPRFHGYLDDPLADSGGLVEWFARDVASRLQIAYRGRGVWIGTEGSTILLKDAIQRILDLSTRTGLWKLKTVGDLEWAIKAFQLGEVNDVLEYINALARERGAVVRWWPDATTARFQLTLFILQANKETPDLTLAPSRSKAGSHGSDTSNVRTDRTIEYIPAGGTTPVPIYRPATQAQIDEYGVKAIVIGTDQTKHIDNAADAIVMLDSVDGALLLPATVGSRIISPSDPTIDVNSLLRFEPDPLLSTENIDLYVGPWIEREDISEGGAVENSITVQLRNAPSGQVKAWLERIAGIGTAATPKLPPTWKYLTRTIHDVIYDTYKLVAWCRIETHGLAVLDTRAQTKLPTAAWGQFGAPDRVTGDESVYWNNDDPAVPKRKLAIGEFEKEVALIGGDAISMIRAEIDVEGISTPLTLFEVSGDANSDPDVIDVVVAGLDARVIADDDSLSVHVVKISGPGSAYSASFDSNLHTFTIPVPAAGTWELEATSENVVTADPTDKVSEPFPFTVTNTGEPTISLIVAQPADGSGIMTIEATATSSPADYRARYLMRYSTTPIGGGGGHTSDEIDITPMMSPSPFVGGLPTTPTTYEYSTGFVRNDADPEGTIAVEVRAEILDADGVAVPGGGTGPYPYVEPWPYRIPT